MQTNRRLVGLMVLVAGVHASSRAWAQSTGAPAPKPPAPPPLPPTPPVGPSPWRRGDPNSMFFTDMAAVERAVKQSPRPSEALEDFRRATAASRQTLERKRAAGEIDLHRYESLRKDSERAQAIYNQLSKPK